MNEKEEQIEDAERQAARNEKKDEPMLFCPVCSQRLMALKCKLICEKCGYYMSCADYY
jgi:hypothetical protein